MLPPTEKEKKQYQKQKFCYIYEEEFDEEFSENQYQHIVCDNCQENIEAPRIVAVIQDIRHQKKFLCCSKKRGEVDNILCIKIKFNDSVGFMFQLTFKSG